MNTQAQIEQFRKVHTIAEAMLIGDNITEEQVITIATAYLLACARTEQEHHPEDDPTECFDAGEVTAEQKKAWSIMWKVIGTTRHHYKIVWKVWGAMVEINKA
ncbi:MAG TPA: hypothetical protein PLE71_17285 [Flavobacteriales bacterium]|nr:hypothetical protein [Flavobacteriales bacterium]HRA18579.1 hypothetical protein [Flavobacteriales bacterium]